MCTLGLTVLPKRNIPLYVASGVFRSLGRPDPKRYSSVETWLVDLVVVHGVASRIVNRQALLQGGIQSAVGGRMALHSEQRAAIDFLVMLRADHVVGQGRSSFSYALMEFRALWMGLARASTTLVGQVEHIFGVAARFDLPVG